MKILILDLETTGLPTQPGWGCYYPYEQLPFYDSSRIVQIGILVYNQKKNSKFVLEHEFNLIIKPENFTINNASMHGITQKIAETKGIDFIDAIKTIADTFKYTSLLVAHNAKFDVNILQSEMYRHKLSTELKQFTEIPVFCTSVNCTDITKIVMKGSKKFKQPKLIELHKYLFNAEPNEKMHDAINDARVLARCFFELLDRQLILLE
jgi:DNA polymerase III epsilon subunit-like protein